MDKESGIKERSCENCRYFSQHYSIRKTTFRKVFCGHCIHQNNKTTKAKLCDYWEDIIIQEEERKKSITETLESMTAHINEILIILQNR